MKSVVRHIVSVDHRDEAVFPTRGSWVQFSSELAGLGGGVAHLKTELHLQTNLTLGKDIVSYYLFRGNLVGVGRSITEFCSF
jgi:outer membrane protein insertion porin family